MLKIYLSLAVTLFFVMDPFGTLPTYLELVKKLKTRQRCWVTVRELCAALCIMLFFYTVGDKLLTFLGITATTVQISGGIVLFLIGIRLIFWSDPEGDVKWGASNSYIVPLATPLIASPHLLSLVMIYSQEQHPTSLLLLAIVSAWLLSAIVFLNATTIIGWIGLKGAHALEKLMGLVIVLISIQKILQGLQGLVHNL